MQTKVYVPLGHEIEDGELSWEAKSRIRTALWAVWEARRTGEVTAVLAHGAGAIPGKDMQTMAEYAEAYCNRAHAGVPMIVNRDDRDVMSTLTELQWIVEIVRKTYGPNTRIVVVSQPKHLRRVRLIHRWFLSEVAMEYLPSEPVERITLFHEFLSYGKLLVVKMGLGGFAERFRLLTIRLRHFKRTVE